MRGVQQDAHQAATNETGDGDGHDPGEDQETDSLPVDSLEGTVAETDTDSGASNAHGGGDGQLELREQKNGNGGTHLHGRTTAGRVVGDLVTHDYVLLAI